ncbi:MAG: TonB-dependent receptor [Pseudomonadota bacterium]
MGHFKKDKRFLRTTAAWALLTGLTAGAAVAQETTPPAPAQDQTQQQSTQDNSGDDQIVITGSRLHQTEFTSPDPIQVISTERGQLTGTADVAKLLQNSTLASGSPQNNATISSAFVTEGGPGSQTISLRGLGANRTLVLVNGRRGGPAGTRGQVSAFDLNVLPLSVIDRIEIDKTGSSSIYGSDAVAGVVNIITKQNLDGASFDVYGSEPWQDGGNEYRAQATWGHTFSRGHITASFDYYNQRELKIGQRDYTSCGADYTFGANGARNDRVDPRTGKPACLDILSGQVWLYEYLGDDFGVFPDADSGPWGTTGQLNSPGGLVKFQYDPGGVVGSLLPQSVTPTPPPGNPNFWPTSPSDFVALGWDRTTQGALNGNPPQYLNASLIPELRRYTAYVEGSYDVASNVEAYAEVLLNRRISKTHNVRQFWTYLYTYDLGDPFNVGWGGFATLSPTPVTDHYGQEQHVDYSRVVGGFRGNFAGPLGDVDWDIYVQGSHSDGDYTQDVILDDAVRTAQFRTGSCVGTTTPISNKPCVDVNWLSGAFLNGNPTPEEAAFLFDRETGNTVYDQVYMDGSVSGDLFALPAGNVGVVAGFEVRRDRIHDTPGPITLAGNSWGLSSAGITKGHDTTKEVFGELGIPLLRGMPLAEDVRLSLSGRYTDVASYGSDSTYKIGLNWQILPDWRIRATKGTSFRAPALYEQFLADQTSFIGQRSLDPCLNWGAAFAAGNISQRIADNCAADGIPDNHTGNITATVFTGGGTGLKAETSNAWTAGIVWSPGFADLNIAVDYFEIEVNGEVTQLGAANIVFGCYNSVNFPNEPLCDLFHRGIGTDPYLIDTVTDRYINIASQVNRGIDLTAQYRHEFPFGDFTAQSQLTWQLQDEFNLIEDIGQDNNGRVGDPQYTGNLDLQLERGDWTFFWGMDLIGPSSDKDFAITNNAAQTRFYVIDTEATVYHSVSVQYKADQWELTAGIRNISDETPPSLTSGAFSGGSSTQGTSAFTSNYDFIGRTTFVQIHRSF